MTSFYIILIVIASIFISIPLYFFIGKAGQALAAVLWGVFANLATWWDKSESSKARSEVSEDKFFRIFWPIAILASLFFIIIVVIGRVLWLVYKAGEALIKFYWKIVLFCWK